MSHFNEKARWALALSGRPVREQRWAPGLHLAGIAPLRARTTPVLRCADGTVLRGSDAILDHAIAHGAPLLPADPAQARLVRRWLARLDAVLGPATRRWFYSWVDAGLLERFGTAGVSARQAAAFRRLQPAVARLIRRRFDLHPGARAEAEADIAAVFAEADAARGADGPYLVGGRFTAADLTFAALGAPLVMPPGYGPPGALTIDDLPAGLRGAVEARRATPSGAAVLELYARHRVPQPLVQPSDPRVGNFH